MSKKDILYTDGLLIVSVLFKGTDIIGHIMFPKLVNINSDKEIEKQNKERPTIREGNKLNIVLLEDQKTKEVLIRTNEEFQSKFKLLDKNMIISSFIKNSPLAVWLLEEAGCRQRPQINFGTKEDINPKTFRYKQVAFYPYIRINSQGQYDFSYSNYYINHSLKELIIDNKELKDKY